MTLIQLGVKRLRNDKTRRVFIFSNNNNRPSWKDAPHLYLQGLKYKGQSLCIEVRANPLTDLLANVFHFFSSLFFLYRKYPEGWTTDKDRDTTLEYRLSIYHAVQDDSGLFTCITPTRHMHAVEIIVKGNLFILYKISPQSAFQNSNIRHDTNFF